MASGHSVVTACVSSLIIALSFLCVSAQEVDTGTMPLACRQAMDVGPCRAAHERYYYNSENGSCDLFYYGGCDGTSNRFDTLEDCQNTCQSDACPTPMCATECPDTGYDTDSSGCQLCDCKPPPVIVCPLMACPFHCPRGFIFDPSGCQTCDCIEPSFECPPSRQCMMYCEHGYKLDQKGCATCQCADEPVCKDVVCSMACPLGGLKKDDAGCAVCECAEDPCKTQNCTIDETCLREDSGSGMTAKCVAGKRWCPAMTCRMFCEHGFATNAYGCEVCQCRDEPRAACPDQPLDCPNECTFGQAYDDNGCQSCHCLSNGCRNLSCPLEGQVCESHIHRGCTRCPITPRCVDEADIQRVHVSLIYEHDSKMEVDLTEFKKRVSQSIATLLDIDLSHVVGVTAATPHDFSVHVNFHLIAPDHLVRTYNMLATKITADDESGETHIVMARVAFVPRSDSLVAVYYTDMPEWEGEDAEEVLDETLIVGVAVAVGVVVVVIAACVMVVACRRRTKKSDPIYKPVPLNGRQV